MALNRYVVRVDPQGKPMDVDILDTSAASVPAFESSQFAAAQLSLPLTISAPTDFWLKAPGPYDVSCKVGTTEIASATGAQRVQVSDVPVLVVPPWEVLAPSSSGGSSAGAPVVRAFPFAFDTPGLLTGAALYTPTVGDVLLHLWVKIVTAWNGTTPMMDIGTFVTVSGFFGTDGGQGVIDATKADDTSAFEVPSVLTQANAVTSNSDLTQNMLLGGIPGRGLPFEFIGADPIKAVVSQNGLNTGADPGSTQGAAVLYLVTATPA